MESEAVQTGELASHYHLPLTAIPEPFPVSATSEGRIYVMAIIKFEGIAADGESRLVPDGYRGLNWDNFGAENDSIALDGILNVIHSGRAAAFNNFGDPAGFKSPDRADDFDLNSGYFASSEDSGLRIRVFGYDDGERVAKQVFLLDPTQEFITFSSQFDDIDEVKFKAKGGTDPNPDDGQPATTVFAVDDLFIDF
jgi:hypothetical protein